MVNKYYEKNLSTGVVTTHYYSGDREVAYRKGTTLQYIHQDNLGSTIMTTNTSGSAVARTAYFPFGGTRYISGTLGTDERFTGQRLDQSGLYYYGARYYDASIGRFISADSLVQSPFDPQSLNRYAYCRNNPLKYVDPTGHKIVLGENYDGSLVYVINGKIVGEKKPPPDYGADVDTSVSDSGGSDTSGDTTEGDESQGAWQTDLSASDGELSASAVYSYVNQDTWWQADFCDANGTVGLRGIDASFDLISVYGPCDEGGGLKVEGPSIGLTAGEGGLDAYVGLGSLTFLIYGGPVTVEGHEDVALGVDLSDRRIDLIVISIKW